MPFLDAGQYAFVMPLIQGFVGQRAFSVDTGTKGNDAIVGATAAKDAVDTVQDDPDLMLPPDQTKSVEDEEGKPTPPDPRDVKNFLLTVISRRSTKRAGLRYLRRGVDMDGHAANAVETEQILSAPNWDSTSIKIYSYVQCRGSIPLLFSQSPYSLKPVVIFQGTPEANASAFKTHFQHLEARYRRVQVASLVDKTGTEAKLGEAFASHAAKLNEQGGIDGKGNKVGFEWFDFHSECRGMKFENIARLFDRIGVQLDTFGWTVEEGGEITTIQSGILRTNCMDCLDRTNVVQSACARNVLEQQLKAEGVTLDLQKDPSTSWFNTVWADNGDAISRQYAGTAALKGDFTRTRKRNISGALTDFGLTLTRYVKNIRDDWFTQTVIDYELGLTDASSFADFEADMRTRDYTVDLRTVRQNAIETCARICVEDAEDLLAGWTLSCPAQPNTIRALPFEECVLLLTEVALYACRVDWATEKVREFERVEVGCVEGVARGVYITSTLAPRYLDERRNVGFVVRVSGHGDRGRDVVRVNTRSLASERDDHSDNGAGGKTAAKTGKQRRPTFSEKILAFKALPPKSSFIGAGGRGRRRRRRAAERGGYHQGDYGSDCRCRQCCPAARYGGATRPGRGS